MSEQTPEISEASVEMRNFVRPLALEMTALIKRQIVALLKADNILESASLMEVLVSLDAWFKTEGSRVRDLEPIRGLIADSHNALVQNLAGALILRASGQYASLKEIQPEDDLESTCMGVARREPFFAMRLEPTRSVIHAALTPEGLSTEALREAFGSFNPKEFIRRMNVALIRAKSGCLVFKESLPREAEAVGRTPQFLKIKPYRGAMDEVLLGIMEEGFTPGVVDFTLIDALRQLRQVYGEAYYATVNELLANFDATNPAHRYMLDLDFPSTGVGNALKVAASGLSPSKFTIDSKSFSAEERADKEREGKIPPRGRGKAPRGYRILFSPQWLESLQSGN